MSDVKFPGLTTSTAVTAIIATAAFMCTSAPMCSFETDGSSLWKMKPPGLYAVKQPEGTQSFLTVNASNLRDSFVQEIQNIFISLCDGQEALGEECEAVWDANIYSLYES